MTSLAFSGNGRILLLIISFCLLTYFLIAGKRTGKTASKFERIAFTASLAALFLSQITSIVSNYNIMERVKVRLENVGLMFDDDVIRESDNTESIPMDVDIAGEESDVNDTDPEHQNVDIEQFVASHPEIIFKDDVFIIELTVRNVTADEKNDHSEWKKSVDADIGDVLEYQIHYKNTGTKESEGVLVRVSPLEEWNTYLEAQSFIMLRILMGIKLILII